MKAGQRDAVASAEAGVVAERKKLEEIEAMAAAAVAELANLEASADSAALQDPGSINAIGTRLHEARTRAELASRAADAQKPQVRAAELAYLAAEADSFEESEIQPRRKTLQAHNAKTQKMLADLAAHEGAFVPEVGVLLDKHSRDHRGQYAEFVLPKSHVMERELAELEAKLQILRDLAAGREVTGIPLQDYPECVRRAGSLVKAPAYVRRVEAVAARVGDLEATISEFQRRIEVETAALEEATSANYSTPTAKARAVDDVKGRLGSAMVALEASKADLAKQRATLGELAEI